MLLFSQRRGMGAKRANTMLFLLALLLILGSFTSRSFSRPLGLQSTKTSSAPKEEWQGMYFAGKKIGYSSLQVVPTIYQGHPAFRETSKTLIRLTLLGQTVEQEDSTDTVTDQRQQPLLEKLDIASGGSKIHIEARYDYTAHKIYCQIGTGTDATQKTVSIPPNANLTGDASLVTEGQKLEVGQKLDLYTLDPITVDLTPIHLEVKGKENLRDENNVSHSVLRVETSASTGDMTEWIDEAGDLIKGAIHIGPVEINMTRETRAHALDTTYLSPLLTRVSGGKPGYQPPTDFSIATAITTEKPISNPRHLRTLDLVIGGIPERKLILSDARQQETLLSTHSAPPFQVTVSIRSEQVDPAMAAQLPIRSPEFAEYLGRAAYLDTEDAGIRAQAAQLKGKGTDTYHTVLAIRNWVNKNMTPDATIGVPQSAQTIYTKKRGVCRDYATLYAAIARAAGIPTRLCAGIVYGEIGGHSGFFYHAWAESYVGKWIAVDPTLYDPEDPVDYVDATHIKFAQGDVTQMYNAVSVVGKLKITDAAPSQEAISNEKGAH